MIETRLLRRNVVERRTGLARSTIYSRMTKGMFPACIKVGLRAVRWREEEIDLFVSNPGGWGVEQATNRALSPRGVKNGRRTD